MTQLSYDYTASKTYCEYIGLAWLGDDYQGLVDADKQAKAFSLTQSQVDTIMRLHLWQTKVLFTPKNYKFFQRVLIAFYFLTGWKLVK